LQAGFLQAGDAIGQSTPRFDPVVIDALDPDAWNGVVFLARAFNQPAPFALRVGSRSGGFLEGNEIFYAIGEVGHTLEWSRLDDTTVVGRLTAAHDLQLVLEAHFPYLGISWGTQGFYSIDESRQTIIG
jgi:hypothetical protein